MAHRSSRVPVVAIVLILALTSPASAQVAAPAGQITLAATVTLAPTWFDPAETPGVITPFLTLYALHDALVKPMPGTAFAPCLAESWTMSKDGLTYEFVIRKGVRFHNGDLLSAEDVKFSFERYKGGGAATLKAHVAAVEVVDAQRIELVVEAFDGYWRKPPAVKRLVFKSVPDDSTRLVMLKRGETDIATGFRGPNAEEVRRTSGLTLKVTLPTVSQWVVFTEQWDPKSPWADRRVRLAANLAIDRKGFSDAEFLGHGKPASSIIPRDFEFYWAPPPYPHDPARAKQLLAEAGYPKGFDAGELATDITFAPESEAVINGLQTIGIRARLRPMERASFYKADQDRQFKQLVRVGSGAPGNASTRIEAFVISGGIRSYGGYPDIDALFRDQAVELDRKRREALLHKIQQLMHERAMFAPIVEQAGLIGVGPRLAEVPTITGHPFISPYEDLKLK